MTAGIYILIFLIGILAGIKIWDLVTYQKRVAHYRRMRSVFNDRRYDKALNIYNQAKHQLGMEWGKNPTDACIDFSYKKSRK